MIELLANVVHRPNVIGIAHIDARCLSKPTIRDLVEALSMLVWNMYEHVHVSACAVCLSFYRPDEDGIEAEPPSRHTNLVSDVGKKFRETVRAEAAVRIRAKGGEGVEGLPPRSGAMSCLIQQLELLARDAFALFAPIHADASPCRCFRDGRDQAQRTNIEQGPRRLSWQFYRAIN